MRVTQHSSRGNKNEKGAFGTRHNDRNKIGEAKNIDKTKTAGNLVWKYTDGDPTLAGQTFTIDEAELKFYNDHFSEVLNSTNESYLKARHKEKVRTMDEWRRDKKHAPEEIILQLGKVGDCPHKSVFGEIAGAYFRKLTEYCKKLNNPFTILDFALHQDELGAPHIHLRRVWHYYNEEKNRLEVGQEKALAAAGIPLPSPDKKPGRYNNRKMVFDKYMRTIFVSLAKEYGLEIETKPLPKEEVGLTLEERILRNEREREEKELELAKEKQKLAAEKERVTSKEEQADFELQYILDSKAEIEKSRELLNQTSEEIKNALTSDDEEETAEEELKNPFEEYDSKKDSHLFPQDKYDLTYTEYSDKIKTPIDMSLRNCKSVSTYFNIFITHKLKPAFYKLKKKTQKLLIKVNILKKENKELKSILTKENLSHLINMYQEHNLNNFDDYRKYKEGEKTFNNIVKPTLEKENSPLSIDANLPTLQKENTHFYLYHFDQKYNAKDFAQQLNQYAAENNIETKHNNLKVEIYLSDDLKKYRNIFNKHTSLSCLEQEKHKLLTIQEKLYVKALRIAIRVFEKQENSIYNLLCHYVSSNDLSTPEKFRHYNKAANFIGDAIYKRPTSDENTKIALDYLTQEAPDDIKNLFKEIKTYAAHIYVNNEADKDIITNLLKLDYINKLIEFQRFVKQDTPKPKRNIDNDRSYSGYSR